MRVPPEPRTMAVVPSWIEAHCVVPDGFRAGEPFRLYDGQLLFLANLYLVRGEARWVPENPVLAPAFVYSRGIWVGPQKLGKNPLGAAVICAEAEGPVVFAGWAGPDEGYSCEEHGCGCGWEYPYDLGEPKGMAWPTPLIQITAFSEDQPLALDTPVPTPAGWTTIGALQVGDEVLDAQGRPTTVARETDVLEGLDCYAVTFSDGERIVASASHSWTLERKTGHGDRFEPVTVSTERLAADHRTPRGSKRYRAGASSFALPPADLPVDPYLLGLWLGDGARGDSTIAIDERDREELEEIITPALGVSERAVWRTGPGNQGTIRIRNETRAEAIPSLRERLRAIGVLGAKHIPLLYLRAAAAQRQALLQGLIDSDGHVTKKGRVSFTNTNERLAYDVGELLTTLGYVWTSRFDGYAYRLFFGPVDARPVAKLQRKARAQRLGGRRTTSVYRYVEAVERVPSVPVRCIGLDTPDHLFLVGRRAVPTHNTDNTYDVLRPMIEKGPLADLIPKTGETFIRLRGVDDQARIEIVTSSEQSRLGARTTFVLQDQLEQWWESNGMRRVADAQYRNLAGVGGRAALLANAWDPSQHSVAEREFTSKAKDVYRQATWAPEGDFADPIERRRILETVYPEDVRRENGGHADLDSLEAEAVKILEYDPPQAERYFGNRIVAGRGRAFSLERWNELRVTRPKVVPEGAQITIGGDGSRLWDHFSLIATELASGYQWPLGIWVPGGPGHEVPMDQVDAVLAAAYERWDVVRGYFDPPFIEGWVAQWQGRWGRPRVEEWWTNRPKAMAYALRAWRAAQSNGDVSHCHPDDAFCARFSEHVGNAVKKETGYRDDDGFLWIVEKDRPNSQHKIDSVPAAALSWEARNDAIAAGALNVEPEPTSAYDDENWLVDGTPRSVIT